MLAGHEGLEQLGVVTRKPIEARAAPALAHLPGAGGTQRLPRAIGKAKAMDLVLTGRMMDAVEAERAGLVSRVVPAERCLDEALALAE
jgi:enoyl-CoA hydratase